MSAVQSWNMPEGYRVRTVTPDSIAQDLMQGPLRVTPSIAEGVRPYIESGERSFFIAETLHSEPVGRVAVNWTGSVNPTTREHTGMMPNLAFMHVREGYRGRGIGTGLIRGVLAGAKAAGFPGVFLTVRVANERARALYYREGFRTIKALGHIVMNEDIVNPDGTFTHIQGAVNLFMAHRFPD